MRIVRVRELNVGCFGGGTGLPSLLGGLKNNPWLDVNAIVTMFDSGGSSGQLRDELGVLPPGDILKCALALSRNAREARRVLLARLPTLEHARLGGLKTNPWVHADAVVTMFDSGGSSGVLRDELGVLPPGDVLKCALALARNAREARRVLLARLPTLEHARLGGHTGWNLLLSMMQRYSGDFLDAIDGLRALLGCHGRVWPVSVQQASVCAEYGDGSITRGEVEVDAAQSSGRFVRKIWLEPTVEIHPSVAKAITEFDAAIIGPGSFYTSLMPIFLVRGVADALAQMNGPVILVANLLTEGRGMLGFTAADAVARIEEAIQRRVDVVIVNTKWPSSQILGRYALEHK